MGVVITGMDMPKNCLQCRLSDLAIQQFGGNLKPFCYGMRRELIDYPKGILESSRVGDCPLEEVKYCDNMVDCKEFEKSRLREDYCKHRGYRAGIPTCEKKEVQRGHIKH